jgi:hypothetical protein
MNYSELYDEPATAAPAAQRTEVATAASQALDITKVNLTDLALARFGPWREQTAKAKAELAALVLDLGTQIAIDGAISLRNHKIKQPLADARKVAKALKSKLSEVSKAVGDELPLIEAAWDEVAGAITPRIDAAQRVIDDAKAAAAEKEAARKAAHESAIETIRSYLTRCNEPGMTAERIGAGISALSKQSIGPEWQEYQERAVSMLHSTMQNMQILHAQAVARELEVARQDAIRIENERMTAVLAAERERFAAEAEAVRREQAALAAELTRHTDEITAQRAESERLAKTEFDKASAETFDALADTKRAESVPSTMIEALGNAVSALVADDVIANAIDDASHSAADVLPESAPPTIDIAPPSPTAVLKELAIEARKNGYTPYIWWARFYAAVDAL